jgi:Uma2 family endonuclease
MAYPAANRVRMSIEEFLAWNSGDDLRYEVVDSHPVAQPAPAFSHGLLVANIASLLTNDLKRRQKPCATDCGSALVIPAFGNVRLPDVHVLCGESGKTANRPLLTVEVVAPYDSASAMRRKLEEYASIGVIEMLEVDQDQLLVSRHLGNGDTWIVQDYRRLDAQVVLESLGTVLTLAEIHEGLFDDGEAAPG